MPTEEQKNVFLASIANEQKASAPSIPPSEEGEKDKKKKGLSGTALFATLFLLFLLVITLLIFVISVGGAQNPVLQSFGIESGEVKSFLKKLVNGTFGSLTVLLLLLCSLGLFRGLSAKKEEKQKRKSSLIFSIVSGGLIFGVVVAWLGMFAFVNSLPATAVGVGDRIEVLNIAPDQEIVAPLTISFSAEAIEQEITRRGKKIRQFLWSKDGGKNYDIRTGFTPRVDILFREQGRHVVALQVELEGEDPLTFDIAFEVDSVVFQANPPEGEIPLEVTFDAREIVQGLPVKTFEWDFDGDGISDASSANSSITHTFENIGLFPVQLTVLLQDDQVRTFRRTISATGATSQRLKALINADPKDGVAPLTVNFSATNSFSNTGEISGYFWDMGDNDLQLRGENVVHTFRDPGSYTVELSVENEQGLISTDSVEILVQKSVSAPLITVITEPRASNDVITAPESPITVTFDASSTTDPDDDLSLFSWDFDNDGVSDASGEKAEHTFFSAGTFPVTLTVTDQVGNISTKTLTVVTQKQSITPIIDASPETGSVPLLIEFDGSKSNCGPGCRILSYEWDFGDGTPRQITGALTSHTFRSVGTFSVQLTVTTDTGETAMGTKVVAVRIPPVKSCFQPSRTSGTAPLTVSFRDCSDGTIAEWKWDFGDGEISSDRAPEHTFTSPGSYTVVLQVTDEDGATSQIAQKIMAE